MASGDISGWPRETNTEVFARVPEPLTKTGHSDDVYCIAFHLHGKTVTVYEFYIRRNVLFGLKNEKFFMRCGLFSIQGRAPDPFFSLIVEDAVENLCLLAMIERIQSSERYRDKVNLADRLSVADCIDKSTTGMKLRDVVCDPSQQCEIHSVFAELDLDAIQVYDAPTVVHLRAPPGNFSCRTSLGGFQPPRTFTFHLPSKTSGVKYQFVILGGNTVFGHRDDDCFMHCELFEISSRGTEFFRPRWTHRAEGSTIFAMLLLILDQFKLAFGCPNPIASDSVHSLHEERLHLARVFDSQVPERKYDGRFQALVQNDNQLLSFTNEFNNKRWGPSTKNPQFESVIYLVGGLESLKAANVASQRRAPDPKSIDTFTVHHPNEQASVEVLLSETNQSPTVTTHSLNEPEPQHPRIRRNEPYKPWP